MKIKSSIFIFLICFFNGRVFTQNVKIAEKYTTASLEKKLALTKDKAAQIPLRIEIGIRSNIHSIAYWESLLADTRLYKLPLCECKILAELAMLLRTENRQRGLGYIEKSVALAETNNYKKELPGLIKKMLTYYMGSNDGQLILGRSYQGLKIAEELKDKQAIVDFYSIIATHYFFVGNINKAFNLHVNCLQIYKELHDTIGIAGSLTDIASDYGVMGDTVKLCSYYLEAGKYAPRLIKTIYASYIYNSVATAYLYSKQSDSAYKYSYLSYQLGKALDLKQGMASSLLNVGGALELKNDLVGAERAFLEAYALARKNYFITQLPGIALELKKLYLKEKKYKQALEASELYVAIKDSISNEKNRKMALEKEFSYAVEKKENENKLLAQQNQNQLLHLKQNNYLLGGLIVLFVTVLIIVFLFLKQNRLKAEQERLQLEQKLLRAQMNPHFIFNSLNSIQQFIISKQNGLAEVYLSKFAKLIRELLENNNKESITVKEEADILRGYLEMESLRFQRSFLFSINLDEMIDAENTVIPHMMIQPFVENAVWHGLLPKGGHRNLFLSFLPGLGKTIHCIIDDNGIGRKKNLGKTSRFKKRSLALDFIRQRIKLIRKTLKLDCSVDIIDKTDASGESLGTRVVLVLPVLNK